MRALAFIFPTLLSTLLSFSGVFAHGFDDWFDGRAIRLDYVHAGDSGREEFYFDGVHEEPFWAGSREALVDETGLGSKLLKVFDSATDRLLFSRGYCTLWDEWRLTSEAGLTARSMPESVTFPFPKSSVRVEIWSRARETGMFGKCFEQEIDPADKFISRYGPRYESFSVEVNSSDLAHMVDVVLLPEGYTEAERVKFEAAAFDFVSGVFGFEPFGELRPKFNVRAVWVPSSESGVTRPGAGVWLHTSACAGFDTFDSERYQMIWSQQRLRDQVSHTPCDLIYVLSNSDKYGGGGVFNFYGLSSADPSAPARTKVHVHEFAHLLAGLGDEYTGGVSLDEQSAYPLDREPWEMNLTTKTALESKPWYGMIGTNGVGLYEGGGYVSEGVFRPWPGCLMNSFHESDVFCPVCESAIRAQVAFLIK